MIPVCVMQFLPPDDEHMYLKHVKAWNKLVVKQNFCASIWLITELDSIAYYTPSLYGIAYNSQATNLYSTSLYWIL